MPLMTQAQYARHRGCTPPTVADAKKVRIKPALVEKNGSFLIDSEIADRLWDAGKVRNSHKSKGPQIPAAAATHSLVGQLPSDSELKALILGLPEDEIGELDVSIKRKEHYNAERAKVGALRDREESLSRVQVETRAAKMGRQVRDLLLIIPSRNAARLAAMSDTEAVRALLEEEIEGALKGLKSNA
jgi:hypothetical protein